MSIYVVLESVSGGAVSLREVDPISKLIGWLICRCVAAEVKKKWFEPVMNFSYSGHTRGA
jgi:hypothetical protein